MKLEAEVILKASAALNRVQNIDCTIRHLGSRAEANVELWGSRMNEVFDCGLSFGMSREKLGQIAFCAVVNALLHERSILVGEFSDLVTFPDPPCPRQTVTAES